MLKNISTKSHGAQSGNATIIALAAVLVVALGAGAFFMLGKKSDAPDAAVAQAEPASGDASASAQPQPDAQQPVQVASADAAGEAKKDEAKSDLVVRPGNPVVAKVGDKEITRVDVFNFIQALPPQTRQMPVEQLFPLAVDQIVNSEVINSKVKGVNLDSDPAVKKEMEIAKKQIVRQVFMEKEAEKAITDDLLKTAYEDYKKNFPQVEEVKARHILVKDEKLAQDLLKQIKDGGDFAVLAKANSIDNTKENGGELNYFAKQEVVPEFAEAAFAAKPGELVQKPVKSEFGYHIIEVMDKRQRQPASFEQAKPFIAAQLRGQVLNAIVQKWRQEAKVETFDVNGDPVKKDEAKPDAAKAEEKKG